MIKRVPVIMVDNIRCAEYQGQHYVVSDNGDTMDINFGNVEERVDLHDTKIVTIEEALDAVFGGV